MDPVWTALLLLLGAALGGFLAGSVSRLVVMGLSRRPGQRGALSLAHLSRTCHWAWTALLMAVAVRAAVPHTGLSDAVRSPLRHTGTLAVIGTAAWLVVRLLYVAGDVAVTRVRVDVADNRRARRLRTQIALARRLVAVVVTVLAVAVMLMTFTEARAAGASLLASAGVFGVVAGVAAQTVLGNVFAGLQLAFTDAMRLDDVIVVEEEWGRVEDITLTYVVLALWDERRLVLPTSYFTTKPFQNWTRTASRVLGAVLLHVDYTTPVEPLRRAAQRIVEGSPLWDRQSWVLQVVDTTPTTLVVRVLASAADAPSAFDLRCEVREKLVDYLQAHHPGALPRLRVGEPEARRTPGRSTDRPADPGAAPVERAERPAATEDVTEPGSGRSAFSS